jgi:ankyrin repeat protein
MPRAAEGARCKKSAQLLIDRGADVDWREEAHQAIPLGVASWAGQRRMVELLGRYSRDVWEVTYTGRVERLRELLRENPALARTVSAEGDTPLMWLPSETSAALAAAKLLLEHGTDPARKNAQGLTAADIAARRGLDDVVALLRLATP